MKTALFLSFILLLSGGALGQKVPSFRQYGAKVEKAKAKKIDFASHPRARTFRTNLSNALKSGVNFGGHYIVATWGCGTNCTESAIVDARTGRVFFPKELEGAGFGFCELGDESEPLRYKADSRLLVLNGFKGGDLDSEKTPCGIYYYEWTGTALKRVAFVKKKRTATP